MFTVSGGSRGANPAMAPHRSWQWSLAPLGRRKNNDGIVKLAKCKDFAPLIDVGYGFGPLKENVRLIHEKSR